MRNNEKYKEGDKVDVAAFSGIVNYKACTSDFISITPDGQGAETNVIIYRGSILNFVSLPKREIKIGDLWKTGDGSVFIARGDRNDKITFISPVVVGNCSYYSPESFFASNPGAELLLRLKD